MNIVFFILGLLVSGALAMLYLARHKRNQAALQQSYHILGRKAETAFDLLASHPNGVLIRDFTEGRDIASEALKDELGLTDGEQHAFDNLCDTLKPNDADTLRMASKALMRYNKSFDIEVTHPKDPQKTVMLAGRMATTSDGENAAQIFWVFHPNEKTHLAAGKSQPMRARAFAITPDDDRVAVEPFLKMLPFPAWRRDQALDAVYVNDAAKDSGLIEATEELARRALEDGKISPLVIEDEKTGQSVRASETPLEGTFGTLGFAIGEAQIPNNQMDKTNALSAKDIFTVLDSANNAISVFAANQQLIYCNPAFLTLWNLDKAWIGTKPTLRKFLDRLRESRLLPEFPDYGTFRDEQSAFVGKLQTVREDNWHLPDGRTLRQILTPGPADGLTVIFEDISDQLSLARSHQKLTIQQREVLDSLREAICVFGSDGSILLQNQAFISFWETSPQSLADLIGTLKTLTDDQDGFWSPTWIERAIAAKTADAGQMMFKDGRCIDIALNFTANDTVTLTLLKQSK